MELSYAQNLEDYHLARLFEGQPTGTYIDVGAGHPVADNVSFWFYLQGWRGLIVEPQENLAALYPALRPRDHAVCLLAGRADGEIDFHIVDRLHGFSTSVAAHAEGAAAFGAGYRTVRKPVRRLDALAREAGLSAIDFCKIDVEGAEADVLAGLDLRALRPRVMVIEAVTPGSMAAEAAQAWEPALLAAGYRFAYFDNLNRFYVAEEAAALAARFPAEPTPWDAVQHLYEHGRADRVPTHPDHALARMLVAGLLASLPTLDPAVVAQLVRRAAPEAEARPIPAALVARLLGTAEPHGTPADAASLAALLATDRMRAALGRIASMYDGGHIVDDAEKP